MTATQRHLLHKSAATFYHNKVSHFHAEISFTL